MEFSGESRPIPRFSRAAPADLDAYFQRLRRERGFLERIVQGLHEGVLLTTLDLKILFTNERARWLLSLPEGRRALHIPLPDATPLTEVRALLLKLDPDLNRPVEEEILIPGNAERPPRTMSIHVAPLADDEHRTMGLLFTIDDTSERHRLEARRRHAEKLSSLATLTAGIAHEIKNPLNSMSIHAQLLRKRLDMTGEETISTASVSESLDVILEEIGRLDTMVDEFLQAVRPTVPWMEPRPINDMLRRIAELARPEVERRGIELALELDTDLTLAQYDERQLGRAIFNLLKNSWEAIDEVQQRAVETATDLSPAKITLKSMHLGDKMVIEVQDTGGGIPEEHFNRIFEPYYTTKFNGTGLGLMNVYRIVQEHGGQIHIDTTVGEGSIFRLTLPLRAPLPMSGDPPALPVCPEDSPPPNQES